MRDRPSPSACIVALLFAYALAGCLPTPPVCEAMPTIAVRPGVAARIALMDRYRHDDEIRRRMMARPQVWVEEVPDVETPPADPTEAQSPP